MSNTRADEQITAHLPATAAPADDVVCLAMALNPAEAYIWKEALEEEGVQCRVVGDLLGASIGNIPGLQTEVWIHRNDLVRAQEILERYRNQPVLKEDQEEEGIVFMGPGYQELPPETE